MALALMISISSFNCLATFLALLNVLTASSRSLNDSTLNLVEYHKSSIIPQSDVDLLEFPLNLEYLEAEFFLWGALGYGLDKVDPHLAAGGPPPFGVRKAFIDPWIKDVIEQFAYQEVGHLRAIKEHVKGFPRPLMNLSSAAFAHVMDSAMGRRLNPPFDPYDDQLNFLLASYLIPYVGLTGYVGANPKLQSTEAKKLVAGLLAVESGQDAVLRQILYHRRWQTVVPYGIKVEDFTVKISQLRNKLGKEGVKDEGLIIYQDHKKVPKGNVLVGDPKHSLGYPRTPNEILRIVYGSGDESVVGGFFPSGADGNIAKSFL